MRYLAVLKYDMNTMRDFSRRLSHFKRLAETGKTIRLVDRQGRRFRFQAEKGRRSQGSAKHLALGKPLGPEPVPKKEWGGAC
jgi:hypothetical protein